MDLVKIDEYWLEWKNWYYANAEKFGITKDELTKLGIVNDYAYLNRHTCELLAQLDKELRNEYELKLIIKDAYRSIWLYKLIREKRIKKEWEQFVKSIFNTLWDFPHASWNTVDVSFVWVNDNRSLLVFEEIDDLMERKNSWRVNYYELSNDVQHKLIHKNRIFIKDMMNKYGFEWIDHEYWHFNLKK
jgi:D-alanyl-D-alanine dipeptidase